MKFLVIGDFHGKCKLPLKRIIRDEKIDVILSAGDYCGNETASKIIFEYLYGNDEDEVDLKILKKFKKFEKKGVMDGITIVKKLKGLKKEFYGVRGNWDPLEYKRDIGYSIEKKDDKNIKKFKRLERKNFQFLDFKFFEAEDFVIVGGGSSSHPGRIDKRSLKRIEKEDGIKEVKRKVREYNSRKKKYEKNFLRAKKKNKPVIFITHNCPYQTKLDKIKKGEQKGKHYGSFLEKQMIRRFKPELVICGHMHENQGRDKIGKSVIVNGGAALEGKWAVVDFDLEKKKVKKVKFFKK